jgi:trimeric autotransporter adhesin
MQLRYLLFLSLIFAAFTLNTFAQLSGTKTIPGDYATIATAVTALNSSGVGAGGVTFNVAADYTESIITPILLTATGTSSAPIVFQKSGSGANPKVTRTDGGTLATSTLGGQGDAIIIIQGSDYVTFDGISAAASSEGIEYGYYLRKASATDGCKYVTIKNSVVDLTKGTSRYIAGIYSSNNDAASSVSSATGITITSEGGRNENVTINGNTIQDVFAGILLRGYNHTSPYNFYDQNFIIGANGAGNTIQNIAGNSANESYGVFLIYHNNANINYNSINNTAGGGSYFTATGYGIFDSTSTNGNGTYNNNNINLSSNTGQLRGIMSGTAGIATLIANNNIIRLSQSGTQEASCIYFRSLSSGSTVNINNNTFNYGTFASTTTSYLIYSSNAASNVSVSGNQTGLINKTGAGTFYCFYNAGSPSGGSGFVQNNIFTNISLTGTSTFYGIYYTGSTSQPKTISGNTISNITGGTNSVYGIFTNNDGAGTQIYSNRVTNISGTGAAVYGYSVGGTNSTAFECFNNESSNISCSGAGVVYGMRHDGGTGSNYSSYSNNIYNIVGTNTSSIVYGIYISSGINTSLEIANVYNNFISDIKAPLASNTNPTVYGVYSAGTNTLRLFFNTIYLNSASSGTNFSSCGVYYTTGGVLDMRNNIIINVSKPGTTGNTVAFRMSGTSTTNYQPSSNNNCLYAGPPRPNKLIFYDGLNSEQTIVGFKTRVAPRESNSFTENVPFVNISLNNLHVKTDVPTLTEAGGIPVSSPIVITTDYDGDTRNATTPDVGADEFAGIVNTDLQPPLISYTLLGAGGIETSRNFPGVSITDGGGVNITSGTAPRVYFKKSTDANTFIDNTSSTNGWKWVEGTGTGPFNFLIDYSLLDDGSVSTDDIIQYFVVAQDLYSRPNVGINSGTFEEQPSSVNLITTNFPILGTINFYSIFGPLSGTILVGTGNLYTSLTADSPQGLFKKINSSIIAGDLTIRITSNLTETGAVVLNQINAEANYSIRIQPDDASPKTISGNYAGGLIRLNGADRIIIDGRFEGSGSNNYLSFANNAASGVIAAIQIISLGSNSGASDITIRNCNISTGFNGSSSYAITSGGSTIGSAGDDNDNLTIVENFIIKAYYGINVVANSSGITNNITINGNTIGSETSGDYIGKYGINVSQADDVNISGNTIFNIISTYNDLYGISLSTGVSNAVISENKIHSLVYTGTGGYGGIGISVSTGVSNANILIKNNQIYNISGDGYDYFTNFGRNPHGIFLSSTQSGIKIYNNSINLYGNTLNHDDYAVSTGIGLGSVSTADIKNNIIVNNLGLLSTTGYGSVGIFLYSGVSQLEASSNNLIFVNASGLGVKFIGQTNFTGYPTLQAWRENTGKDIYSYNGDPSFTSNTNLLPDNTNPNCWAVNNKGMPLTDVATDFNGNPRSTTRAGGPVDIGAYEFSTSTIPPTAAQGGTLANNQTTTYSVNNFQSGAITWGAIGTVPSSISFRYYSGIAPANNASKCYWEVTNSGGSGFSYNVTFNYDETQIGNIAESNLRLTKSDDNGINWIPYLISGTSPNQYQLNTSQNNITVYGLTSFSLFTLTDSDDPLPVELNSFTVNVRDRDIILNWITETEVNSYGFEIERSEINLKSEILNPQFTKIGFVTGHGNSNSPEHYSFTDKNQNSGKYIYRLKMVDNDGTFTYSNEVESEIEAPKEFLLLQNYPNPFNPTTKIEYQLPLESSVTLEIYNINGERVGVLLSQQQAPGYYSIELNSASLQLSSGIYIYRMTAQSSKDLKSFTQLKKMVLLK